jgi:regulator of RNase E activity RraA
MSFTPYCGSCHAAACVKLRGSRNIPDGGTPQAAKSGIPYRFAGVNPFLFFEYRFRRLLNRFKSVSAGEATGGKVLKRRASGGFMTTFRNVGRGHPVRKILILLAVAGAVAAAFAWAPMAKTPQQPGGATDSAALLEGYRHVEVASVSDAIEQLSGRKMYMSHRMRPIFNTRFAGFALTVLLKKEANEDPNALNGMLAAIDQGTKDSVYVMVVEDGNDIAGMGGLMGTAMSAREFSGAVVDGGVRDVAYLQKIAFPVYALGIVPSTSIRHYRFAGSNIAVVCDGVEVKPADIVVADTDGVVVVPRADAAKVLALAQEMDFKEHSMYAYIEKLKSIQEAVKKFGRL